jgi:hypothetical protein
MEPVQISEGTLGKWSVMRFSVSEDQAKFTALRAAMKGRVYVPPGTYTRLECKGRGTVMSDTPDEMRDHGYAVHAAHGHVLLNGLGIGMVLTNILKKKYVTAVTVVEIDADVIALVGPNYTDPRVTIIHESAFEYAPPKGTRYGAVWHDIWDTICGDNIPQMTKLKRKYGRRADWQGCWCEHDCKRSTLNR